MSFNWTDRKKRAFLFSTGAFQCRLSTTEHTQLDRDLERSIDCPKRVSACDLFFSEIPSQED